MPSHRIWVAARYASDTAHRPALKIYPGATHSFDARRPERDYFGHHLNYDEAAANDAIDLTRQFFDAHLHPENAN